MNDARAQTHIEPELSEYRLSVLCRLQCRRLGVDEALLPGFAHLAARVTHPGGEYRYGDYVLDIDGDTILSIAPYSQQPICPDCHGTGMHRQAGTDIPCQHPNCSGRMD
jgi:hypothetical protein